MENTEPLEPVQVGTCCQCGGEIYAGNRCRVVDEGYLHRDGICMAAYITEHYLSPDMPQETETLFDLIGSEEVVLWRVATNTFSR